LGFKDVGHGFEINHNGMRWVAQFAGKELHISVRPLDSALDHIQWGRFRRIEYMHGISCVIELILNVSPIYQSMGDIRPEIPDCIRNELARNGIVLFNQIKLTQNEFCQPEEDISTQSSS
jgi:hypothetical protein